MCMNGLHISFRFGAAIATPSSATVTVNVNTLSTALAAKIHQATGTTPSVGNVPESSQSSAARHDQLSGSGLSDRSSQ